MCILRSIVYTDTLQLMNLLSSAPLLSVLRRLVIRLLHLHLHLQLIRVLSYPKLRLGSPLECIGISTDAEITATDCSSAIVAYRTRTEPFGTEPSSHELTGPELASMYSTCTCTCASTVQYVCLRRGEARRGESKHHCVLHSCLFPDRLALSFPIICTAPCLIRLALWIRPYQHLARLFDFHVHYMHSINIIVIVCYNI